MKSNIKLDMPVDTAKSRILAYDAPRKLKVTAILLFEHERARIDPDTGTNYTNAAALSNVLKWLGDCRLKQKKLRRMPTLLEQKMLQMLVDGLSQQKIAEELDINVRNAKRHFANMRRRLGVKTTYQALALCVRYGWVDTDGLDVIF